MHTLKYRALSTFSSLCMGGSGVTVGQVAVDYHTCPFLKLRRIGGLGLL